MNKNYNFCKFSIPEKNGKVIWEITNKCNYSCEYCIFSSTGKTPDNELSTDKIKETILELKKNNFTYIKFTGGEPFLHPDFLEILSFANKNGFNFDISTNASAISDEISFFLSTLINLKFIHVSLDGHNQNSHEIVRGKNSFLPTILGIKNLSLHNKNIRIGTVLHSSNEKNIQEMVDFFINLKANEIVFSKMEPIGRMHGKNTLVIKSDISAIINQIENISSSIKISHNLLSNTENNIKSTNICPGGSKFLFIDSFGIVSPCTWISEKNEKYHYFNLNNSSLSSILKSNLFVDFLNFSKENPGECPVKLLNVNNKSNIEQFNKIYSFSTENLSYLNLLQHSNYNSALTITGSGDQSIVLSYLGYKHITNIDSNLFANYYAQLKIEALKKLSFIEFKSFFLLNDNCFNYHVYKKINKDLEPSCKKFWNKKFLEFNFNGYNLRKSNLFNLKYDNNEEKISNSFYLRDELTFIKTKTNLNNSIFEYINENIISYSLHHKYDIILLSNLADYSHIYFKESDNYLFEFKINIVQKLLPNLNPAGLFMFAYIFDFENINNSNLRNKINEKFERQSIFSDLNYSEILLKSSIPLLKNDAICFFKY